MSLARSTRPVSIARHDGAAPPAAREDVVAVEEPLEIREIGRASCRERV
jgi:hypothetical protein